MTKRPRPHMPLKAQRDACLLLLGLDPGNVEWDHEPALRLRAFDEETRKYIPDANDPRFIRPLEPKVHRKKTGGDAKQIAAKRRDENAIDKKVAEQEARLAKGRAILAGSAAGKLPAKEMRPAELRKTKRPGGKLPRKHPGGQRTATRPPRKTTARKAR